MEHPGVSRPSPPLRPRAFAEGADAAERQRRAIEVSLANVLDASPDLVGSITLEHRPVYMNAAGRRLLGVGADEEIGDFDVLRFYPPADARRIAEEAFPTALATGCWTGEVELLDGDGRPVPMLQVILSHAGSGGERFLSTVARDISELKSAQAASERERANAERANRAKSEFLANMSHELRTPLNAVIGFAEMLVDRHYGDLNERQGQCLANILESGRHLLDLINDILDLTKVEAGRLDLAPAELDAGLLVIDLAHAVRVLAERKGIGLAVDVRAGLPAIHADPRRLKQIVLNLLSNAVKFTLEGGRILVSARPATEFGEPGGIWLSVADSGIGIRAEDQARLFLPFEQIDGSHRRSQQGSGLGLALSRRLAELHGGRIWLESGGIGCGSTFHLVLPAGGTGAAV